MHWLEDTHCSSTTLALTTWSATNLPDIISKRLLSKATNPFVCCTFYWLTNVRGPRAHFGPLTPWVYLKPYSLIESSRAPALHNLEIWMG